LKNLIFQDTLHLFALLLVIQSTSISRYILSKGYRFPIIAENDVWDFIQ